eukprot:CAMPEP_0113882350 /NCGR_PEP_ID=MMETSP0780_2-20120614/8907_1 /TAXON_ID=652834 /ORGANISM="Palpitomonas bilix" /LENGTH=127 /DNA_ID=CAMNT_0000869357 /DNA_START=304 /DNA_END=687 /DNA_ORIENTATION=- /assembly_acc=CAM_ASM_000599
MSRAGAGQQWHAVIWLLLVLSFSLLPLIEGQEPHGGGVSDPFDILLEYVGQPDKLAARAVGWGGAIAVTTSKEILIVSNGKLTSLPADPFGGVKSLPEGKLSFTSVEGASLGEFFPQDLPEAPPQKS